MIDGANFTRGRRRFDEVKRKGGDYKLEQRQLYKLKKSKNKKKPALRADNCGRPRSIHFPSWTWCCTWLHVDHGQYKNGIMRLALDPLLFLSTQRTCWATDRCCGGIAGPQRFSQARSAADCSVPPHSSLVRWSGRAIPHQQCGLFGCLKEIALRQGSARPPWRSEQQEMGGGQALGCSGGGVVSLLQVRESPLDPAYHPPSVVSLSFNRRGEPRTWRIANQPAAAFRPCWISMIS